MATAPVLTEYGGEFRRVTPKRELFLVACSDWDATNAEICRRDFRDFIREFWSCVSQQELKWNWHMDVIAEALMKVARQVAAEEPKENDVIINVPPGTSKSTECTILFPIWCWINWPWMRFICASYSSPLSLDHGDKARNVVKSDKFKRYFPELRMNPEKDAKGNFQIMFWEEPKAGEKEGHWELGGGRFATSVGGSVTGFHAHIILVDDPLNPKEAVSALKLKTSNDFMDQTLSTRKVDKKVSVTILIMQRLHENDPSGHWLSTKGKRVLHICLPGEIHNYKRFVRPVELILNYENNLLDPVRMDDAVLADMKVELGQYGYAGQVGQNPVPPQGGMFHPDQLVIIDRLPNPVNIIATIRYWDKAGTEGGVGAATAGCKMSLLRNGKYLIHNFVRGRWGTDERESNIEETAKTDGKRIKIFVEQEPGSGGLDSARATVKRLAGYSVYRDRPKGDKVYRADPFSVQVNEGNVYCLAGDWIPDFKNELTFFPLGTVKDMVDAASGAFGKLAGKRPVRNLRK